MFSIIQVIPLIFISPFSKEQHIWSQDRTRTCKIEKTNFIRLFGMVNIFNVMSHGPINQSPITRLPFRHLTKFRFLKLIPNGVKKLHLICFLRSQDRIRTCNRKSTLSRCVTSYLSMSVTLNSVSTNSTTWLFEDEKSSCCSVRLCFP